MADDFVYRVQEIQRIYPDLSADEAERMAMGLKWELDDRLADALAKTNPLADLAEMIRQRDSWHDKYRYMSCGFWTLFVVLAVIFATNFFSR